MTSDAKSFDLAVIGGGSAGFSAAITAAEQGANVALVSHGTIGGTCVNVGCVPSKNLIRAAEVLHSASAGSRFSGIEASGSVSNWTAIIEQKDALVEELRQAKYIDLLPDYPNVKLIEGQAKVLKSGMRVNETEFSAEKIILATGSRESIPPIEGLTDVPYLTSTTAFELDHLPKSMLIIGGGVIGCEIGQMFARMGTKVTLLCRSRLLPSEEPEISAALETYLLAEGIDVVCGAAYKSLKYDGGVCLSYELQGTAHRRTAENILIATGRRPNSDGLGLEEAGIETSRNGGIIVNDRMQTTLPNIYAAGDVTGRDQYVYMAAYGAKIAAQNALNSNGKVYDARVMPRVTFTDPQVASVGLTEQAARDQGHDTIVSVLPLKHVPRALAARDTRGLFKLVAEKGSNRLLGAHIIAPEGADSIQTAALALKQGLLIEDLADMIYPYLTTVEGLKLAAQTFNKDISKLSCCAG
jgi:mercuric reductase